MRTPTSRRYPPSFRRPASVRLSIARRPFSRVFAPIAALLALLIPIADAVAQKCKGCLQGVVMTRWDFNQVGMSWTSPIPSLGAGSAHLVGGVQPNISGGQATGNNSSDRAIGSAWIVSTFPDHSLESGTAGLEFRASTLGYTSVQFLADLRCSKTASAYWRVSYSVDAGLSWSPALPSDVVIFSTDFQRVSTGILPANASNVPDLRVRLLAVFPEEQPSYQGVLGSYTPGGTLRVDNVQFYGVPAASTPPAIDHADAWPRAVCGGPGSTASELLLNVFARRGAAPTSSALTLTGDFSALGGGTVVPFLPSAGDFVLPISLPAGFPVGLYEIPLTLADEVPGRTSQATISLAVVSCNTSASSGMVISEFYPGAGSGNALFNEEYVVLHNRSSQPIDISNWSIQYGASGSAMGFVGKVDLLPPAAPYVVLPGQYFLVQTSPAQPGGQGVSLASVAQPDQEFPSNDPNFTRGIRMNREMGRLALVSSTALLGPDLSNPAIVDLVGYGRAVTQEGAAPAPIPDPVQSLRRRNEGRQDTNQNFHDFVAGDPAPLNRADSACIADLDDGSGAGVPSGGVDVNDLLFFLRKFEEGSSPADLDENQAIDINDLLLFLARFEAGC